MQYEQHVEDLEQTIGVFNEGFETSLDIIECVFVVKRRREEGVVDFDINDDCVD